jgi:His/Glu/Gln/Arg/opine family amino acid ABC transporter permease subunit
MTLDPTFIWRHADALFAGLLVTLSILSVGGAIAIAGGAVVLVARIGMGALMRRVAMGYVVFFRTTPEVILIFWAYYCIPFVFGQKLTGFWAGSITLGMIGAAYLSEILRGGIDAVPKGQREAAISLGLPAYPTWRCVILPQALRLSVPPFVNYFTEFLKNTTLLAAIGVGDLALAAFTLGGQTYRHFEFLTVIAILYFLMILPVSLYARTLERRQP